MNKQDFFTILKEGLNDFPKEELDDILKEYEEAFNSELSQGKTEEEAINNLGNPFMIINNYRNNYFTNETQLVTSDINTEDNSNSTSKENNIENPATNNTSKNNNNLILKIIIVALVLVLFGPFLFAAFGVLIAVLVSIIAIPFSILIGGTAFLANDIGINIAGFTFPSFLADFPINSAILITLGSLFATMLLILLTYYLIKFIVLKIKNLISKKSNKEV